MNLPIQELLFHTRKRKQVRASAGIRAVDLFAGAGGFTEGAARAGIDVVWAANHCPQAVAVHQENHPDTVHSCQDLRQADFTKLPDFDLLLASPACQGHSTASQPNRRAKHDADRSTAWAVVDCVETCRPSAFIVENVPAFTRWQLYPIWREALDRLGYSAQELVLDAADFGVPQNRKRVFIVGHRARCAPELEVPKSPSTSSNSILAQAASGWRPVASKPEGVRRRVARGRARLGRRFLSHHVTGHPGRSLARPIGTITTVPSHWHLVEGDQMRPLSVRELARAQGFSDDFILPAQSKLGTRLVGNAVPPPLAASVVKACTDRM